MDFRQGVNWTYNCHEKIIRPPIESPGCGLYSGVQSRRRIHAEFGWYRRDTILVPTAVPFKSDRKVLWNRTKIVKLGSGLPEFVDDICSSNSCGSVIMRRNLQHLRPDSKTPCERRTQSIIFVSIRSGHRSKACAENLRDNYRTCSCRH